MGFFKRQKSREELWAEYNALVRNEPNNLPEVPEFYAYWGSENNLTPEQASYYKRVKYGLKQGLRVEIDGQIGYVKVYISSILPRIYTRGPEYVRDEMLRLGMLYYDVPQISYSTNSWAADCLLFMQSFEEWLEETEPKDLDHRHFAPANQRLAIQEFLGLEADPVDVVGAASLTRTKLMREHPRLFFTCLREVFSQSELVGKSWFEYLQEHTPEEYYPFSLFNGQSDLSLRLDLPVRRYDLIRDGDPDETFAMAEIMRLHKSARNLLRERLNLPGVGEGWIEETKLYNLIKEAFPETIVLQHGRPPWLGRQHFDIWIPRWRIAVEYQGQQHFEPVEFFGGEEGFELAKERDRRKKRLAKKNGVLLIEVKAGYSSEEVLFDVKNNREE